MKVSSFKYILLFSFLTLISASQPDLYLNVLGEVVTHKGGKVGGAIITVFHDDKEIGYVISIRNGKFGFDLEFETEYLITVEKPGFITSRVTVDTHTTPDIEHKDWLRWDPVITLYPKYDEVDDSYFNQVTASYKLNGIYFDEIESLKKKTDLEASKVVQKVNVIDKQVFEQKVEQAKNLIESQDYESALMAYQQADELFSDNKDIKKQIKALRKEIKQSISVDESYANAIDKAEELFNEKKWSEAIGSYQRALLYKPQEEFPLNRLYTIDSIQSAGYLAQKHKYNKLINNADSLFNTDNYQLSRSLYEQAIALGFSDDIYPKDQMKEIDNKQDAERLAKQQKEEELKREAERAKNVKSKQEKAAVLVETAKIRKPIEEKKTPVLDVEEIEQKPDKLKQEEKADGLITSSGELQLDSDLLVDDEEIEVAINKLMIDYQEEEKAGNKKEAGIILGKVGTIYQNEYRLGEALNTYQKSLTLSREINDPEIEMEMLNSIATVYFDSGRYEKAIENFKVSLDVALKIDKQDKAAEIMTEVAQVYSSTFRYDEAVEYLNKSLEIKEKQNDENGITEINKSLGNIYYEKQEYEKSVDYFKKSLDIEVKNKDTIDIGASLNNIGVVYYNMGEYEEAINYYENALEITEKTQNKKEISITLNNIGNVNYDYDRYDDAISYYERSLEIKRELDFIEGIAVSLHNLGNSYFKLKEYKKALEYYTSSLSYARQTNYVEVIARNLKSFSETYEELSNYKLALKFFKEFSESKFRDFSDKDQISEMREQYEATKRAVKTLKRELKRHKLLAKMEAERNMQRLRIKDLEIENKVQQLAKQRIIILSFVVVLILIVVFGLILGKQYQLKNRAYSIVARQKELIVDSIEYAGKIQTAVLPPDAYLDEVIPQYFLLNMPRDAVGGDFYWVHKRDDELVIAVADCTGHGVPGGFMSMLGVAYLNEIVNASYKLIPHEILDKLRTKVIDALHQKIGGYQPLDGMDIALAILNTKTNKVVFSGAYHPMYLVRDKKLEIIKSCRVPIGLHMRHKKFTSKEIQLHKDDMIYFSSDGYPDQIGQETNRRYLMNRFTKSLENINGLSLEQQKQTLIKNTIAWRGGLDQTDDILILGIKI